MPAWGDAAGGANEAFFAVLKQRELERQHALEAELMRMRIENARQEMDLRGKEMGLRERELLGREGSALADQLAPGAFLAEDDPAVATMQKSGRGSLLTKQNPTLGSRSMTGYQSLPGAPVDAATRVEEHPARPTGFLKTRSQKQIDTDTDNERQRLHEQLQSEWRAQQEERNRQRDLDIAENRNRMAEIAQQNADANTQRAQREPQGRETFGEWKQKYDYERANPKAATKGAMATGQQKSALAFFNRMLEAERNARSVEDKLKPSDIASSEYAPAFLENWLKSKEGQAYTQAQRMFTEARLRKESGAAINPSEYENDRRTNFRVAGDRPETIAQKRAARLALMRGLGNSAGPSLQEFYGEGASLDDLLKEFAEAQPAAGASGGGAFTVRAPNGKTYRFPSQEAADRFKQAAGIP